MSDEASCYLCGNPRDGKGRVCLSCAARFSDESPLTDRSNAPLHLEHESAENLAESLEEMARRRLGESVPRYKSAIPLPPQMREEKVRVERTKEDETRRQAVVENASRLAARREVDQATVGTRCVACAKEVDEEGAKFSFCLHCGADLPSATKPKTRRVRKEDPSGVRDVRSRARELGELHRQAAQHQLHAAPTGAQTELSPVVAAILAFVLPGLGQLLNRQVGKGVILMVGFLVFGQLLGGIGSTVIRVLCAIDAYRIAERRRKGEAVGDGEWDVT